MTKKAKKFDFRCPLDRQRKLFSGKGIPYFRKKRKQKTYRLLRLKQTVHPKFRLRQKVRLKLQLRQIVPPTPQFQYSDYLGQSVHHQQRFFLLKFISQDNK